MSSSARARVLTAVASAMVLTSSPVGAQINTAEDGRFDHTGVAHQALARHIRPTFASLRTAFQDLQTAAKATVVSSATCAPRSRAVTALEQAFRMAVQAWGRSAHLNFGPLAENNRYERLYFWLDRKGIARRQVMRALQRQPAAYLDPVKLGERSIGVQGLPALELVLGVLQEPPFGNSNGNETTTSKQSTRTAHHPGFYCRYAVAITGNLVRIADAVHTSWAHGGKWSRLWTAPGPENPRYLKPDETTFALIRALIEHVERVRDVELLRPLGFAVRGRPLPGPFARSNLTMPFLAARLAGLQALSEDTGLHDAAAVVARKRNSGSAAQALGQLRFELAHLVKLTAQFARVPKFFESDQSFEAHALGWPLKAVRAQAKIAFALTTDLPVGFNATDGD